jgi:hypothetical protein
MSWPQCATSWRAQRSDQGPSREHLGPQNRNRPGRDCPCTASHHGPATTPDSVTHALKSTTTAQQRLRARLLLDVPSVDADTVDALLTAARADGPRTARQIDAYLASNPDGLLAPDPSCPLGIVRLTQMLVTHGHGVTPPACARCGRRVHLPRQDPSGRICESCHRLAQAPRSCTRCGRPGRPHARFRCGSVVPQLLPKGPKVTSGMQQVRPHPAGRPACRGRHPDLPDLRPAHRCMSVWTAAGIDPRRP